MPTNVPSPTYGPNGLVLPQESAILAGVLADINDAFGVPLNPALSTPQGQLASSETSVIGDANALLAFILNNVDPAFSSGRMQDGIGRIYYLSRLPALPTVVPVACSGLNGVQIPVGATIIDSNNVLWLAQQSGTIVNGTVTLPFACSINGPTPCAIGFLNTTATGGARIYQTIFGWDSANNAAEGALGQLVENRAQFEQRRQATVAANSVGQLDSVIGALLELPGVLDAYVTENVLSVPQTVGGVVLAPKSLYACVLGGTPSAIAQAIWTKKAPGCSYNGNMTVIVSDPNPQYNPPPPSYAVAYQVATLVPFFVVVTITNGPSVPSNATSLVQTAVIAAFAGADGGPRAKIGSKVFAARFYAGIAALGPWSVSIASIFIGVGVPSDDAIFFGFAEAGPTSAPFDQAPFFAGDPGSTITASISGSTLIVTAVLGNPLSPGVALLQDTTGDLLPGTMIVGQISGNAGSTGNYLLNQPQTVGSETMTVVPMGTEVQLNIYQAPTVAANNIALVLQ